MGTGTHCAWCFKPMLDAEHARTHVLEQCEKAPWRERMTELSRETMTLRTILAVLVARAGGELRIATAEVERLSIGELVIEDDAATHETVFRYRPRGA